MASGNKAFEQSLVAAQIGDPRIDSCFRNRVEQARGVFETAFGLIGTRLVENRQRISRRQREGAIQPVTSLVVAAHVRQGFAADGDHQPAVARPEFRRLFQMLEGPPPLALPALHQAQGFHAL